MVGEDAGVIHSAYKTMTALLKLMLSVFWREEDGEYQLQPTSRAGVMVKNLDTNLISTTFNDHIDKSRYTKVLMRSPAVLTPDMNVKLHGGVMTTAKVLDAIGYNTLHQIQSFKLYRTAEQTKKTTNSIIKPLLVKEVDLWLFANALVKEVFRREKWDKVKIDKNDHRRVGAALCLLQLGCGSRALGVIAMNEITSIFGVEPGMAMKGMKSTEEEEQEIEKRKAYQGIDRENVIRVRYITKEKDQEKKAVKRQIYGADDVNEAAIIEDIQREVEASGIDKGLQYYFFDPMRYNTHLSMEERHERYSLSKTDKSKCKPSFIFFQLLQVVRDVIRGHEKGVDVKWTKYVVENGDRTRVIYHVKKENATENFVKVYGFYYRHMRAASERYLSAYLDVMTSTSTHALRRLYVCYSYQMFAQRHMKEIGYAQAVFRHASISSSVFYISLQIDMTVHNQIDSRKEMSIEFSSRIATDRKNLEAEMTKMRAEMTNMLLEINDCCGKKQLPANTRALKMEARLVPSAVGPNGKRTIVVDRITPAGRGVFTLEEMIVDRLKTANAMDALGVHVTQNFLKRLGVNTKILARVWALFLFQKSQTKTNISKTGGPPSSDIKEEK